MHTFGSRFSTINSRQALAREVWLVFIFDVHLHGEISSCREGVCECGQETQVQS